MFSKIWLLLGCLYVTHTHTYKIQEFNKKNQFYINQIKLLEERNESSNLGKEEVTKKKASLKERKETSWPGKNLDTEI